MSRHAALLAALALAACGEPDAQGPPPAWNKVPPTLPRVVRERTLAEWLERAQSPEAAQRAEAPWALVELSDDAATLAPVLERLLDDPDVDVRYGAAVAAGRSLADLGPGVYGRLVTRLAAPERGLAAAAHAALVAAGARALPATTEAMGGPDAVLVLRVLAEMGPKAATAAEPLLGLYARREDLRPQTVLALERLGAQAAPTFLRRLPDAGDEEASVILRRLLPASPKALAPHVEALVAAFRRPGPVRAAAADALTVVGAPALPFVEGMVSDPDPDLSAAAKDLLDRLRNAGPR